MADNYERFKDYNPRPDTQYLIDEALAAYEDMADYDPTLRSIYYQLVAAKVIDNKESEYNRLISVLTKARNGGLFPWDAITDKERNAAVPYIEQNVESALWGIEQHLVLDWWDDRIDGGHCQEYYVEVWVEKKAQEGVVKKVADRYQCTWMACKGYMSASEIYDSAKRIHDKWIEGRMPVIIHLGDHDPSGVDMTRDIVDRLRMYSGADIEIDRIALNKDQIYEHHLPADPAKFTDSRAKEYVKEHGPRSWELDALKPQVLEPIIAGAIESYCDMYWFNEQKKKQKELRKPLEFISGDPARALKWAKGRMMEEE